MVNESSPEPLEDRVQKLEQAVKALTDDASVGPILKAGKFTIKWPARIQGPTGNAYILVRKPGGRLETVPAATHQDSDWTDDDTYELLPVGSIVAYAGAETDVPANWHLCDGTNGTYDLRDKFLLGGTFAEIGTEEAGAATAIDDHDDHDNHVVTQPATHSDAILGAVMQGPSTTTVVQSGTGATVASSTHDHIFNAPGIAHEDTAVDAHSSHSSHAVSQDYVPPSYKLAFIQRIS